MKLFDDEQMTDDQLGLVIDIDARFQLESERGRGKEEEEEGVVVGWL